MSAQVNYSRQFPVRFEPDRIQNRYQCIGMLRTAVRSSMQLIRVIEVRANLKPAEP